MHPAIRTQSDYLGDEASLEAGTDSGDAPDMARQEFKDEADINKLLARYGVQPLTKEPIYGDVDYNLDLQQALAAIDTAGQAWQSLPKNLKEKYPTWQLLLNALHEGRLKIDMTKGTVDEVKTPIDTKTTVPPTNPDIET